MIRLLQGHYVVLWVVVLTLAFGTEVGGAGATNTARAASLKVSVPASMAHGSVLTVKASGYSGPHNTVSWSSVHGGSAACGPPNTETITMKTVPRNRTFKVKLTNIFGAPGAMTICVYLFTGGAHPNYSKGHYIVKRSRVEVS